MQKHIRIGKLMAIVHRPRTKTSRAIIMVHGFGGEGFGKDYKKVAESLCAEGYFVFRFLFSGFHENDLTNLTISREVSELKSALDFVEKQKLSEVGIVAQSLGCVVSIILNDPRVKAIVLLSP